MGAGHSIAVQNFNENIGILVMVGLYALMVRSGMSVNTAIVLFGLFVAGTMLLVMFRHHRNQARGDSLHLIGVDKSQGARRPERGLSGRTDRVAGQRIDRPVRKLVGAALACGKCRASSAEISSTPCHHAVGEAALAKRRLHSRADRLPRRIADDPVNAAVGDDLDVAVGEQQVDEDAAVLLGVPDAQQAEHLERTLARDDALAGRGPPAAQPRSATHTCPRCVRSPSAIAASTRVRSRGGNARRTDRVVGDDVTQHPHARCRASAITILPTRRRRRNCRRRPRSRHRRRSSRHRPSFRHRRRESAPSRRRAGRCRRRRRRRASRKSRSAPRCRRRATSRRRTTRWCRRRPPPMPDPSTLPKIARQDAADDRNDDEQHDQQRPEVEAADALAACVATCFGGGSGSPLPTTAITRSTPALMPAAY